MAIQGFGLWRAATMLLLAAALVATGCKTTPEEPAKKVEPTGPHAALLKLFPGPKELSDWKPVADVKVFGPAASPADAVEVVETDVGADATLVRSYEYVKSASRRYTRGTAGETVTLRVFDVKSPSEAFGLFSVKTTGSQFPPIGLAARMSNTSLGFAKGPYCVSVDYSGTNDPSVALGEFARYVADQITSPGYRPALLENFPPNSVQGERYYLHTFATLAALPFVPKGDPVTLARMLALGPETEVAIMGYTTDAPGVLNYLFVIRYPNEALAQSAYKMYEGYLANSTNAAEKNVAVAPPVRAYVAGTFNAEENSVKDQLAKLLGGLGG